MFGTDIFVAEFSRFLFAVLKHWLQKWLEVPMHVGLSGSCQYGLLPLHVKDDGMFFGFLVQQSIHVPREIELIDPDSL